MAKALHKPLINRHIATKVGRKMYRYEKGFMKYLERYNGWLHLIGWLVYIASPLLFFSFSNMWFPPNFGNFLLSKLAGDALLIAFFYLNLQRLIPNLLSKKNVIAYVGAVAGALLIYLIANDLLMQWWRMNRPPMLGQVPLPMPPPSGRMSVRPPFGAFGPPQITAFLSFCLVTLASSMIALVRDRLREREEKQQIQLEKIAAELAVLKLQISPHFLFNTLNNIRWLTRQKSDNAEEAVVKLSQLLRYVIYQANHERVPLTQEIEHLAHFIDLQKMRLTDQNSVSFVHEGAIERYQIEPLLFLPFVENAFKYGLHSQQKSDIVIGFRVGENHLLFFVENPIFENNLPKEGESGLGIKNVERRLALHYPQRHELHIYTNATTFRVELSLELAP